MASKDGGKLRFDNRVVIITGTGGDSTKETLAFITGDGGNAIAAFGSVADRETCEAIVATAIKQYGRVDVLINNAGIDIAKPFEDMALDDLSRTFDVHVMGSWHLSQFVWPHMKKAGYGKIVMVCSSSIFGMPSNSAYVTAKGALYGLMRSLAYEEREFGIKVNALGPVAFTPMAKTILPESQWDRAAQALPAWTTSPVCAWLAHEANEDTGKMITSYGRSIGRMFLAETKGVFCGTGEYTIDTVKAHYEEARDEAGYIVPTSVEDESKRLEGFALYDTQERPLDFFK
ncbi:hypothetical protein COCCADRAFT_107508 [Bipolaris zeicola 26-R-13]|uniref:Uncharacterized protein n=1 Tax=Cochliobolus carbonum (strain 26-R-13) TaxID=930089 RepID=W6XTU6_COCC2|nr:uncharacterized protein COCCADRAFT_107508 [Bipolaris zeicola 26-R-13]EUC29073.1 hypothetical protein COCCADRAFT_107508 [Bipolaris zeicola 26-R-13]